MKRSPCATCGVPTHTNYRGPTRCRACRYSATEEDRFWAKVDASGDCWMWTGARDEKGYGRFNWGPVFRQAHRIAYELLVGPISVDLQIDHLCRVASCVNPDHLEAVTGRENRRRSPTRLHKARIRAGQVKREAA